MKHVYPGLRLVVRLVSAGAGAALLGLVLAAASTGATGPGATNGSGTETYREQRYRGVVGQTDWYTCGPAAAATLLHFYYGVATDETSVLQLVVAEMKALGQAPAEGITALALVRAFETYGFQTLGYRLTPEALDQYFRAGGLPVILHVTRPEHHYVVGIGLVDDYLVVADPSWGRRIEPLHRFLAEKGFSGVTLVPLPPADLAQRGPARQAEALAEARARLQRLSALGRIGL